MLYDADNQGYPYVKRFLMEASKRKQNYLGENPNSQQIILTDQVYPRIQVTYGGADEFRGTEEFDVEQFIAVKGYKAKGKRLTTYQPIVSWSWSPCASPPHLQSLPSPLRKRRKTSIPTPARVSNR